MTNAIFQSMDHWQDAWSVITMLYLTMPCCATCRDATGLADFNIANTRIYGAIPDSVRMLGYLERFVVLNTRMYCCNNSNAVCTQNDRSGCLPGWLSFSSTPAAPPYDYSTRVQTKESGENMR